jgi:hypothetical protein
MNAASANAQGLSYLLKSDSEMRNGLFSLSYQRRIRLSRGALCASELVSVIVRRFRPNWWDRSKIEMQKPQPPFSTETLYPSFSGGFETLDNYDLPAAKRIPNIVTTFTKSCVGTYSVHWSGSLGLVSSETPLLSSLTPQYRRGQLPLPLSSKSDITTSNSCGSI